MNNIAASQKYQGTQVALLNSPKPSQKEGVPEKTSGDNGEFQAFGSDGFTFSDFLDIINPLQHIPIISTFYRNATGDTIDPGSQIAGGTLFGGPIGAVASIINVVVGETTGMDVGEHAIAMFSDKPPGAIDTKFAEANTLANFETASGMPKEKSYAVQTGAESAVLEAENTKAQTETYPEITGAEIELLKAESRQAANTEKITRETGAESAILKAEAKSMSPLAGWTPSPVPGETEVLDWARKEAAIAAEERAVHNTARDNAQTGAVAELGGWFAGPKTAPPAGEGLPSPVPGGIEVLDWARKEAVTTAEKRTAQNMSDNDVQTGAVAELGGWFAESNYSAAASYRKGAALTSAVKAPTMNFLE